MINGQIKYYALLIASITGIAYLTISYAEEPPVDTRAYDALNEAEGIAKNTNKDEKDSADETRKNNPSDYLHQIADNTYAFLKAFNYFSLNWLQIYTVPTSTKLDAQFGNYRVSSQENLQYQLALLKGGSFDLLDPETGQPKTPAQTIKIEKVDSIYSLNAEEKGIFTNSLNSDVDYVSLVNNSKTQVKDEKGTVISPNLTNAKYFIKNASGINLYHPELTGAYDEKGPNYKKYITFLHSIQSISSYNAYILNEQLADLQNGFKLTQAQTELKNLASNKTWFDHVNTELSMGVILRQLLLFNSQTYVLMSDLLTTQKQLLAATAMTNTLIIANSGFNEKILYDAVRRSQ